MVSPALLLVLLTQLPALRALARYAPVPELFIPIMLCATICLSLLLLKPPRILLPILHSAWPTSLVMIGLSFAIALAYPIADGLKTTMGGSDADDAIQLGATALWHLQNPYALSTYFGNPLSPGPGWLALWGPLAIWGLQPLGTPLALAFAVWALRRAHFSWLTINTFSIILASCLGVWELAAVGNDLVPFGLLLLGVVVLLGQARLNPWALLGLALWVGALATARIAFFYLPILIGFALLAAWPKRGLYIAIVGSSLMFALHSGFWWLNPNGYPPLHLLGRAESILQDSTLLGALGILGVTGIAMLYHWRWWNPLTHTALGLGVPLAVIATAELASGSGQLALWEGATFLIPALPLALMATLKLWPPQALPILPIKKPITATKNQTSLAKRRKPR